MTSINDGEPKGKPKGKYGAEYRELWLIQVMADPLIAPRHVKVANVIAMHTNTYNGQAWMNRDTMVRLANVCERPVDRAMNALERGGHLRRHTEYSSATGKRSMRCWPKLWPKSRWTGLSLTTVKLVHNLWTKVAEDTLTRDTPKDTQFLTVSIDMETINNGSAGEGSEVGIRDSKATLKGPPSIESPSSVESPRSKAYRLAAMYEGNVGRGCVGRAERCGGDIFDILCEVDDCIDRGGDLGESLAYFWKEEW
jgi:hypothetical protein